MLFTTAGGILADDTQVLVYLTHKEDYAKMNEVVPPPFLQAIPQPRTVIVAGLMVPDAAIEIVAYAHLKN